MMIVPIFSGWLKLSPERIRNAGPSSWGWRPFVRRGSSTARCNIRSGIRGRRIHSVGVVLVVVVVMARTRVRCRFTLVPCHSLCNFPSRHEWILLLWLLLLVGLTGVFLPGITSATAATATTTTMMLMVGDNSRMGSWKSASPRRWSHRNRR
jgi:hypothetical protein